MLKGLGQPPPQLSTKKNNASNFRVFQTRKLRGKLSLNPLSVLRFIELSVRNNQTKIFGFVRSECLLMSLGSVRIRENLLLVCSSGIKWTYFYPWPADSISHSVRPFHNIANMSTFFQIQISQLWDLIKTWDFQRDHKSIVLPHEDDNNDNK